MCFLALCLIQNAAKQPVEDRKGEKNLISDEPKTELDLMLEGILSEEQEQEA